MAELKERNYSLTLSFMTSYGPLKPLLSAGLMGLSGMTPLHFSLLSVFRSLKRLHVHTYPAGPFLVTNPEQEAGKRLEFYQGESQKNREY
jgi:hypothetical protein